MCGLRSQTTPAEPCKPRPVVSEPTKFPTDTQTRADYREQLVDRGVGIYTAAVAVGEPALFEVLLDTPEEVAGSTGAAGDASSTCIFCSSAALFCSFVDAIEAYEIGMGRPPRLDRVAEAVGIASKWASVQ